MCRQMQIHPDEFLAMVTEGVVHGVYKVVTWSPFGVTWRHKASGKWMFCHCVIYEPNTVVEGQGHVTQHLSPQVIPPVV